MLYCAALQDMTYAQQLRDYEEAVMRKRLEEMPQEQLEQVLTEVEIETRERERRRAAAQAAQKQ